MKEFKITRSKWVSVYISNDSLCGEHCEWTDDQNEFCFAFDRHIKDCRRCEACIEAEKDAEEKNEI